MFIPVHDDGGREGGWGELAQPATLRLVGSLWLIAAAAFAWNVLGHPDPLLRLGLVLIPLPVAMMVTILVAIARAESGLPPDRDPW